MAGRFPLQFFSSPKIIYIYIVYFEECWCTNTFFTCLINVLEFEFEICIIGRHDFNLPYGNNQTLLLLRNCLHQFLRIHVVRSFLSGKDIDSSITELSRFLIFGNSHCYFKVSILIFCIFIITYYFK